MEHLSMLSSNHLLQDLFLSNMLTTTCKRNKDLEETLGPWKYPDHKKLSPLTSWSNIYIYIYIYMDTEQRNNSSAKETLKIVYY